MCRAAWGGGGNSPQPGAPSPQEEPCQHAAVAAGPQCSLPVLQGWELAEEMGGGGAAQTVVGSAPQIPVGSATQTSVCSSAQILMDLPQGGMPHRHPIAHPPAPRQRVPAALPTCVEKRPWPSHPNCSSLEWGAKAPSANVRTPQPLLCLIQPGS